MRSRTSRRAGRLSLSRAAGRLGRRLSGDTALGWLLAASVAVVMFVGIMVGLLLDLLVDDVRRGEGGAGVDRPVLTFLAAHREGWVTAVMRAVTTLGSPVGVTLTVVAGAGLLWLRSRRPSYWVIAGLALGGAGLIETVTKDVVDRARPPAALRVTEVSADGFSFPSGHATLAAAGYGVLAVLVVRQYGRLLTRVAVWAVAVAASAAVGFSRLYLGVHWLTDVLAGWLLASIWLTLLFTSLRLLSPAPRDRGSPRSTTVSAPTTTAAPDRGAGPESLATRRSR